MIIITGQWSRSSRLLPSDYLFRCPQGPSDNIPVGAGVRGAADLRAAGVGSVFQSLQYGEEQIEMGLVK